MLCLYCNCNVANVLTIEVTVQVASVFACIGVCICAAQEASGCGQMAGFKCFTRQMQNVPQGPQRQVLACPHIELPLTSLVFSLSLPAGHRADYMTTR